MTDKLTGDNVDYYLLNIQRPKRLASYQCECSDIIEALGMSFNEGEAFKAIWRRAALKLGNGKPNATTKYDAEKIAYYGNRILAEEIDTPSNYAFVTCKE